MNVATTPETSSRAKRMKAATTAVHQKVDDSVMAAAPFASRENYARFLRFQHRLHNRVEPLYSAEAFQALLPGLAERSRLTAVEQDFADLGLVAPAREEAPALPLPEALGWLYVVEGSNMGAAFLLKAAGNLGLNSEFGARHLAPHEEGRGLHWRRFTAALDGVDLPEAAEAQALAGAEAAFSHVLDLVAAELR